MLWVGTMKSHVEAALAFRQRIQHLPGILQIILFGSVARGEDTSRSDIDIAIVHDRNDPFELMKEVNKDKLPLIQTTFVHLRELAQETELVGALSGEGLLLYGRPLVISEKKINLTPRMIIVYSLAKLPQTEKVKVSRALHGSRSRSTYKKKEYQTQTAGMVKEPGIEKISNGVLLVERSKAAKVVHMLKRFNVAVREIPLWGY